VGDFRVFEEGVEQQVVSFGTELGGLSLLSEAAKEKGRPASPGISPAASNSNPPTRRTYLVVIDALYMSFENSHRVSESLQKLFEHEEGSDSHYALVALGRQLRILRSVTRHPADILTVARSNDFSHNVLENDGSSAAVQELQLKAMLERHCRYCPCDDPLQTADQTFGRDRGCRVELDRIESWTKAAALERTALTRSFLLRLREIVSELAKQPGKRVLVLVSDGFELWAGEGLFSLIAVYTSRPSFVQKNPGDHLDRELEEITRAATSGDVVIYSVDSRGLPAPTFGVFDAGSEGRRFVRNAGPILFNHVIQRSLLESRRQDAMARLADATGGVFYSGNNDLARGMKQAFADGREYYVLAYVPSDRATDGGFRKIRVEVKNKKLTVRAKEGYWAPRATASLPPWSPR
jgi:VWFA-related protein